MLIECCSKEVLRFEVVNRIKSLGKNELVEFKIKPCEVLENTFNLEIKYSQKNNQRLLRRKGNEM